MGGNQQKIKSYETDTKRICRKKLKENNGLKGIARIFISNMLFNSYLQTDKDFYTQALRELDNL